MKWIEPEKITASGEITNVYGDSILLAEQLTKRGLVNSDQARAFLEANLYKQSSPFVFKDMEKALARIEQAIQKKQRIGIWGDFDVDGQTSTALLLDGLRRLDAQVVYHIPNRAKESHGIQLEFLKEFMREDLGLLITCDTGISEIQALQYAAEGGLDVILSDHHTPPQQLPPAYAIINPKLLPADHPMAQLAGVGVAFQIIRALYERNGMVAACPDYYDLVALGTIADLAELNLENRFYAQMGLKQMREKLRPALEAILTSADYRGTAMTESLIGFTIAPRLNAVGRLDDANQNVVFLLSDDPDLLSKTANRLEDLNSQRKLAVENVYQSARDMLVKEPQLARLPVLVLAKSGWEKGVVGIAASRLVEDFNKPVILLNIEDEQAAGSVRSIEGVNIIRAISENDRFLNTYGGHPMAAGLSLNLDQLVAFRMALSRTIERVTGPRPPERQLQIDSYLPLSNLNRELADEINHLSPFGNGNPPPVLVSRNLEIEESLNLGKNDLHRKVTVKDQQGEQAQVLWWNSRDQRLPRGNFNLAYYLRLDEFKGQPQVTLEWIDWQDYEVEKIEVALPVYTKDIKDFRLMADPLAHAARLVNQSNVCFWGEGLLQPINQIPLQSRLDLKRTAVLVILTPPPCYSELQEALKRVRPKQVILYGIKGPDDNPDGFLKKLSGLIKYAMNHYDGVVNLQKIAATLGQTSDLVKLGLDWWDAHGEIRINRKNMDEFVIEKNSKVIEADQDKLTALTSAVQTALNEVSAFRSFYLRTDPLYLLRKV